MFYIIVFIYFLIGAVVLRILNHAYYRSLGINQERLDELFKRIPFNNFWYKAVIVCVKFIGDYILITFWCICLIYTIFKIWLIIRDPYYRDELRKDYLRIYNYDETIFLKEEEKN